MPIMPANSTLYHIFQPFYAAVYAWNKFLINICKDNVLCFKFLLVTSAFHDAYLNQQWVSSLDTFSSHCSGPPELLTLSLSQQHKPHLYIQLLSTCYLDSSLFRPNTSIRCDTESFDSVNSTINTDSSRSYSRSSRNKNHTSSIWCKHIIIPSIYRWAIEAQRWNNFQSCLTAET